MHVMPNQSVRVALVSLLAVSSCGGGDDESATCGTFAACGGAVEGTWTAEKTCTQAMMAIPTMVCGDVAVDFSTAQAKGDVTFAKDGTYTGGLALTGTAKIMIPAACLSLGGQTLTCDTVPLAFQLLQTQNPDLAALGSITCTGTTSCTCTAKLPGTPQASGGTYATSGNNLLLTSQGQTQSIPYCAKGTRVEAALALPTGAASSSSSQAYVILKRK